MFFGKLANLSASHAGLVEDGGSDDLDGVQGGGVTTGHLHVHLGDGTAERHVSVLLVHVDGIGAGEIAEEDTVVSDGTSLLLENLGGGDDLTLDLADLVLSLHLVPELGASEDGIAGKDAHTEKLGVLVRLSDKSATDDVELSQLS